LQLLQEEYTSSIENRYGFITSGNTIRDGTGDNRKAQFCACVPLCVSYTIYKKSLSIQEKKRNFFTIFSVLRTSENKDRLVAGYEDMLLTTKNVNPIIENSEG
jgi:hypothetical protein